MVVSVGFLLTGLTAFVTLFWCGTFSTCEFSKYEASVTVTDAKTQEPLANRKVKALTDYGSAFFISVQEGQTVITDSEGQASIEFNRAYYAPLSISVVSESPETRSQFVFRFRDIRKGKTLSQIETEYSPEIGETNKKVKLVLEVGNWSLGKAQVGLIEE
jgi:hypothetical protein